jgi:hypothetical protein
MGGTGITIDTAVLTSAVRVNVIRKPDVRTGVGREDRAGRVFEKLGGRGRVLRIRLVWITDVPQRGKAVGGITRRPTTGGCFRGTVHSLRAPDRAGPCWATGAQDGTSAGRWCSACEDRPLAKVYQALCARQYNRCVTRPLPLQPTTTVMAIPRTNRSPPTFSRAHWGGLR